jgi:hypothetical protein
MWLTRAGKEIGENTVIVRSAEGEVCNNRGHKEDGIRATVQVVFGLMPQDFWRECSGKTYSFCDECAQRTIKVIDQRGMKIIRNPDVP